MGMFDKVAQDDFDKYKNTSQMNHNKLLEELEKLKNSSNNQFALLQELISKNATTSDEIAHEAASRALDSKRNIESIESNFSGALEEINRLKLNATNDISTISEMKAEAITNNKILGDYTSQSHQNFNDIANKKNIIDVSHSNIEDKVAEFNSYLTQSKDFPSTLEAVKEMFFRVRKIEQ